MGATSRREFLSNSGALGALAASALFVSGAKAAIGPNDKFDLVIRGGEVIDPSQSLRGKRDIGIRFGVIEAVEAKLRNGRCCPSTRVEN
jgi:dihydroorotase